MNPCIAIVFLIVNICSGSYPSSISYRSTGIPEFRPAGAPVNLTVTVSAHNQTEKQLQLNVYWSLNSEDGDLTESYNIRVWPLNESDPYCSTESYYAFIDDKERLSWQVPGPDSTPGLLDSIRIIPGCAYSIRLEANPHDGKPFTHTDFYVPDCVGEVCSCRNASSLPAPNLFLPIAKNHGSFNISWALNRADFVGNITLFAVRDLAARNILIDEKKTLKISDFGLSRRGIYVNRRKWKVPLRWLSLEAMSDSLYSTKSDVWAFAIVLWEIGTLGGFPYPTTVSDYDLLRFLNEGHCLEKPDIVSDELYQIMRICWSEKTDDRPSFTELATYLGSKSSRNVYVDIVVDPHLPQVQYVNVEVNNNSQTSLQ